MSNFKPIKTNCWIKFLILQGCEKKKDNGGSHSIYKKKGVLRPIPVREKDKQVPPFHIQTSLKTLNIDKTVFLSWVKENC